MYIFKLKGKCRVIKDIKIRIWILFCMWHWGLYLGSYTCRCSCHLSYSNRPRIWIFIIFLKYLSLLDITKYRPFFLAIKQAANIFLGVISLINLVTLSTYRICQWVSIGDPSSSLPETNFEGNMTQHWKINETQLHIVVIC
jgi:hypothetical protein